MKQKLRAKRHCDKLFTDLMYATASLSRLLLLQAFCCLSSLLLGIPDLFSQTVLKDTEISDWLRRKEEIKKPQRANLKNQYTNIFTSRMLLKHTIREKKIHFHKFITNSQTLLCLPCYQPSL